MQRFRIIIVFPFILYLTSCTVNCQNNFLIGEYLEAITDGYCNHYCDYPESLDELLSYMQVTKNDWMTLSDADTIKSVVSFLEQERNSIVWNYSHPAISKFCIEVINEGNVLFKKSGDWNFPYLDDAIHSFVEYHLEYPHSLNELLCFDSIHCIQTNTSIPICWKETKDYLLEHYKELEWESEDDRLMVKSSFDTIVYNIGDCSQIKCDSMCTQNNNVFVFANFEGTFVYDEELKHSFQIGLLSIRNKYLIENQYDECEYYLIEYNHDKGLSRFCKNDKFSLETKWFNEIRDYVVRFAEQNELERILFVCPAF